MAIEIKILVAVYQQNSERYYENLSRYDGYKVTVVNSTAQALDYLADMNRHVDILVVNNELGGVHDFIAQLRQRYPRILIILVDEEADFGMPGQADELVTNPFADDELGKRIKRMISDRRMETIRSDSLPAVRNISKGLKTAQGIGAKQEAAVQSVMEMGFDYAAYYHVESSEPIRLTLKAQEGSNPIKSVAPKDANAADLMGWVAQTGQSRIAGPEDSPNHPLVRRGRLGAVACVPVAFNGKSYGTMIACRDRPNSITQENVLMLELVSTQLAMALAKELKG